ncbi:MAG: hypothetical protein HQ547_06360 [Candidatus Omnitrophica bacterium]|nr:hypothetical protein [Candidatus Omnitrophota bacterium]
MYKIFLIFIFALVSGCSSSSSDQEVLVKINNYSMSPEDFISEVKAIPDFRRGGKTDEELVQGVIEEKLILLQAQREGLDRQAPFMEMVERFWEQSLLRAITEKKMKEFLETVSVTEEELKSRYDHMGREIEARVLLVGTKKAAEKLTPAYENFQETIDSLGADLIADAGINNYRMSEEPSFVEEFIFSLPPEQKSAYTQVKDSWLVVKIRGQKDYTRESFAKLEQTIRRSLMRQKAKKRFKEWVDSLRRHAKIYINEKALNKVLADPEE